MFDWFVVGGVTEEHSTMAWHAGRFGTFGDGKQQKHKRVDGFVGSAAVGLSFSARWRGWGLSDPDYEIFFDVLPTCIRTKGRCLRVGGQNRPPTAVSFFGGPQTTLPDRGVDGS